MVFQGILRHCRKPNLFSKNGYQQATPQKKGSAAETLTSRQETVGPNRWAEAPSWPNCFLTARQRICGAPLETIRERWRSHKRGMPWIRGEPCVPPPDSLWATAPPGVPGKRASQRVREEDQKEGEPNWTWLSRYRTAEKDLRVTVCDMTMT